MKNIRMKSVLRHLLAATAAAVILAGAAGSALPAYALTTAPKKAEKEETASAEDLAPQVYIHQYYESEWEEIEGENRQTLDLDYAELEMPEASAKAYPKLKRALDRYNRSRVRLADDTLEDMRAEIATMKEEGYPFYGAYTDKETINIRRCDEDVFSFVRVTDWYGGGAHGYSGFYGTSFDVEKGRVIELTDLIPSENDDALREAVTKELREAYDKTEAGYELWFDLEGYMEHYSVDADPDAEVDYEDDYKVAYTWVLDPQGVTFFFNPYALAAYAAGAQQVTILFDEYPELFSDAYEGTEKGFVLNFKEYEDVRFDRDGVGETDELEVLSYQDEEDWQNGVMSGITIRLNGREYTDDSWNWVFDFRPMLVRTEDGLCYLYVVCMEENDWEETYVYDLNGRKAKLIGSAAGGIEPAFKVIPGEDSEGRLIGQMTDPEAFRVSSRSNVLSTLFVSRPSRVGDDGMPEPTQERWETGSDFTLTLKRATTFDCVDDEGKVTGKTCDVRRGDKVIIRYTDMETYCDAETEDGTMVRIYQESDEEYGWPYSVNGVELEEMFDGVMFAG